MKAAFDLKNLWLYGKGIGTFSLNLLHDVAASTAHPNVCVQLYSPSFDSPSLDFVKANPRFQKIPTGPIQKKSRVDKVKYDQWTLPNSLRRHKPDVLFSPYFDIPLLWNKPAVTTVHDLSIFEGKEGYGAGFYLYYKMLLQKALRQSSFIVTVSHFSKKKIVETFSVPEEKIKIIYNKVPLAFLQRSGLISAEEKKRLKVAYNLPDEFILYTGGLEKRKNIGLLVQGWKTAKQRHRHIPDLLVTGIGPEAVTDEYRELLTDERIRLLPYLPYGDLTGLYKMASLLVNASGYEGFGIPVLEALTVQQAVLCSGIPVYREVGERCAHYFESGNTESFAQQLGRFFKGELPAIDPTAMAERAAFFNGKNYAETFFQLITQSL